MFHVWTFFIVIAFGILTQPSFWAMQKSGAGVEQKKSTCIYALVSGWDFRKCTAKKNRPRLLLRRSTNGWNFIPDYKKTRFVSFTLAIKKPWIDRVKECHKKSWSKLIVGFLHCRLQLEKMPGSFLVRKRKPQIVSTQVFVVLRQLGKFVSHFFSLIFFRKTLGEEVSS